MPDKQTIIEILHAASDLAWPAFAFVIFLSFRKPILRILEVLETIRWKSWQLDFRREFEATHGTAEGESIRTITRDERERARAEPRAVVLESWLKVADSALAALKTKKKSAGEEMRRSPQKIAEALLNTGILDPEEAATLLSLGKLRNVAAHAPNFELNEETTIRYARLAEGLAQALSRPRK